jgi:general secretion pathway protein G
MANILYRRKFASQLCYNSRSKFGFTLIELIVVIAIIAILAAVITPNAFKAIEKAKVSRVMADTKTFKTAAMAYYGDVGLWPPDVYPQEDPGFMTGNSYQNRCVVSPFDSYLPTNFATIIQNNWDGPYIEKFPPNTPWGGSYDWEFWPVVQWQQRPGTYVSVRPKYIPRPTCNYVNPQSATDVPQGFELKLQQMFIDCYIPNGINRTDGTVILKITQF